MEFKGRIYKVFPVQSGTNAKGSNWQRQDFIFEYFENPSDRWSDKVLLSVMNERIKEYDLHDYDEVLIGFGHTVNEHNGRYYNDHRIYKFEKLSFAPNQALQSTEQPQVEQTPTPTLPIPESEEKEDDLPF